MKYDYLIVGSGLFGSTFAYKVGQRDNRCMMIDKRPQIGGNLYCTEVNGIQIHAYGPHIFHTSNDRIWNFVNDITPFRPITCEPLAMRGNKLYHLPFNMNTFYDVWGITSPVEARMHITEETKPYYNPYPSNLEQACLCKIGPTLYDIFVKDYSQKMWGRPATELPASIIGRLPIRYTFNNNYFDDCFQGIPEEGYNTFIEKLLMRGETDEIRVNEPYQPALHNHLARKIVYTGSIDEYFDYQFGNLEYRSLHFETIRKFVPDYQGAFGIRYLDAETPYTRSVEYKHLTGGPKNITMVVREYPLEWKEGAERFYPINNEQNNAMFSRYKRLADKETNVIFGGRLAEYRYWDMHQIIASAMKAAEKELERQLN
jgi:UDP-galactopyranose mutase